MPAAVRARKIPGVARALLAGATLACATGPSPGTDDARSAAGTMSRVAPPDGAFRAVLDSAAAGNADSQNVLGFMLFFGESAPHDPEAAWFWFDQAARGGSVSAQVNLALLHELGTVVPRNRQEALRYFRQARENPDRPVSLPVPNLLTLVATACAAPVDGGDALLFSTYCAGCHGRAGIAAYEEAPNFAFGERMEKSDEALLETIRGGHGHMPQWTEKLPEEIIRATLRQARRFQTEFRHGTLHRLRPIPARSFRFGAMADQPPWFELEPAERPVGPSFDEACRGR